MSKRSLKFLLLVLPLSVGYTREQDSWHRLPQLCPATLCNELMTPTLCGVSTDPPQWPPSPLDLRLFCKCIGESERHVIALSVWVLSMDLSSSPTYHKPTEFSHGFRRLTTTNSYAHFHATKHSTRVISFGNVAIMDSLPICTLYPFLPVLRFCTGCHFRKPRY